MTREQQYLLQLIYSAVTETGQVLPTDVQLERFMPMIKAHQIGGLVYYGAVNCGVDTRQPVMQELLRWTYQYILADHRQIQQLQKLMTTFDAKGIHYMPLKGMLLKSFFPQMHMRVMGDGDILIKMDQYDRIKTVMEQLGYDFQGETDHELIWQSTHLRLELHKRLIPSYNYDYAAYYGDGWQLGHPTPDNPCRFAMTDEDQMIYLFTHFAKHYRDGGIGIRHMLDLYMYRKAKPQMNENYIVSELQKLQLQEFYGNICRTLAVWFEGAPAEELTDKITMRVFASGAYGATDTRQIAQGIRDKANAGGTSKQVRRRAWLHLVFLPYSHMQKKYPVLEKAPVLLPVMWVVRWLDAIFRRPQVIKQQRSRVNRLTEEKLDAWEMQMNEVGLAFHFEEK